MPGLAATASGKICSGSSCRTFRNAPAYHDHNWGVWRDVTWEWGLARGSQLSLLYGGSTDLAETLRARSATRSPFFLSVLDSLGVKQVLRFERIDYQGAGRPRVVRARAPDRFSLIAARERDTLRLNVHVVDALATRMGAGGFRRVFLQMRGRFASSGWLLGRTLAGSRAADFSRPTPGTSKRPASSAAILRCVPGSPGSPGSDGHSNSQAIVRCSPSCRQQPTHEIPSSLANPTRVHHQVLSWLIRRSQVRRQPLGVSDTTMPLQPANSATAPFANPLQPSWVSPVPHVVHSSGCPLVHH